MYNKKNNGSFFSALYIRLIPIAMEDSGQGAGNYCVKNESGGYDQINAKETDDFFEQIGDTYYYFHPDEILATRFADLLEQWDDASDDKFMQSMKTIMFNVKPIESSEPSEPSEPSEQSE